MLKAATDNFLGAIIITVYLAEFFRLLQYQVN